MFSVDLAGVSFLKTNQKRKWFFQKLAIIFNSSLSKNTQEEMNNSEDEDPQKADICFGLSQWHRKPLNLHFSRNIFWMPVSATITETPLSYSSLKKTSSVTLTVYNAWANYMYVA